MWLTFSVRWPSIGDINATLIQRIQLLVWLRHRIEHSFTWLGYSRSANIDASWLHIVLSSVYIRVLQIFCILSRLKDLGITWELIGFFLMKTVGTWGCILVGQWQVGPRIVEHTHWMWLSLTYTKMNLHLGYISQALALMYVDGSI